MRAQVEFARLAEASGYLGFLSEEEREASGKLGNAVVRKRFQIGRGLRRKMLSEVCGVAAGVLRFCGDGKGKPRVENAEGWDFNVSHSGDLVAVAVAQGAVGIDVEKRRVVREMGMLVARYFHPEEADAWRALDGGLREEAFFLLWSAREAAMKCVGIGLARGLSVTRVDPAILSGGEAGAAVGGTRLTVRRLDVPRGYVGVIAQVAR